MKFQLVEMLIDLENNQLVMYINSFFWRFPIIFTMFTKDRMNKSAFPRVLVSHWINGIQFVYNFHVFEAIFECGESVNSIWSRTNASFRYVPVWSAGPKVTIDVSNLSVVCWEAFRKKIIKNILEIVERRKKNSDVNVDCLLLDRNMILDVFISNRGAGLSRNYPEVCSPVLAKNKIS